MFRWIKSKWQGFKDKVTRDFHNTTIYNFREFIRELATVMNVGCGVSNICLMGLAAFVGGSVGVWFSYVGFCILTPACFIGVALAIWELLHLRKLDTDAQWWTYQKAEKFSHALFRATLWTTVDYIIVLLFWVSAPLHASIFAASFLPNVVALKLLILDLFWIPMCLAMVASSWTNLFFTKFKYYLRMIEFERLENREARSLGSMGDWCDEDEILDHKLARMGL